MANTVSGIKSWLLTPVDNSKDAGFWGQRNTGEYIGFSATVLGAAISLLGRVQDNVKVKGVGGIVALLGVAGWIFSGLAKINPEIDRSENQKCSSPYKKNTFEALQQSDDLRREVESNLRKNKSKVKEIRMRELGFNKQYFKNIDENIKLKITKYKASNGTEFFIQFVNKDNILFGLLRLRFPYNPFLKELKDAAIIRELHVYGKAIELGKKNEIGQHTGLGKRLMQVAENIAKENNYKNIAVISGVGVREYYRKLGYNLKGFYMVKHI